MKIKYFPVRSISKIKNWFKTFCAVTSSLSPSLAFAYAEKNYLSTMSNTLIDCILDIAEVFVILAIINGGFLLLQGKCTKIYIVKVTIATGMVFSARYYVHVKFGI